MNDAEKHEDTEAKHNDTDHLTPDEALAVEQETPSFAGNEPVENEQGTESVEASPALSDADLSENQQASITKESQPILEHTKEEAPRPEQPAPTVMAAETPAAEPTAPAQQSGGVLVLQWLTYAFWFWLSISISWLAAVVINYYIANKDSSDIVWSTLLAYPLASVIITFVIALVADKFYSKHEPTKKVSGANVIMLLHVVPFVLFSIGALITLVFALITMLLNSDPVDSTDGPLQVMLVALIVAILFALAAVRAFYGVRRVVRLVSWGIFALLAVGFIVAGFAGPGVDSLRTKDDRLIEQALPSLASDIREYASQHNALPEKITDITHEGSYASASVQKLIDRNLVTYKANTLSDKNSTYNPGDVQLKTCVDSTTAGACYSGSSSSAKEFYYQLCTVFTREKKSTYNYTDEANYTVGNGVGSATDYRSSYLSSIDSHPAGPVCYNLYAEGSYEFSHPNPVDDSN